LGDRLGMLQRSGLATGSWRSAAHVATALGGASGRGRQDGQAV
jgi:hypothetical protein